ncbi:hypothetical protein COU15_03305 [Candidatus Kaiserbacteria bacterium CG10_big_fil_rev_8_21_14_0_10_45_20]|uniref:Uncharacterized protein n=1 Tax=Candidatus Kaiserbacteria bacterium CG10_big_fil_rev_8_21_14_0_10_45_20 TaxID=1974607 RepID=A0A2H0UEV7_9BACT|nr:MAG: hypothetical protein COU15_03305 [Candidatus Kaiserbacteria bacterium CG10_big_fil_rev_8_21_14_0_10_45_20]
MLGGVGGDGRKCYFSSINLKVDAFKDPFETPVLFADIPIQLILGQSNFFINFKVLFERDKAVFKLSRVPTLED